MKNSKWILLAEDDAAIAELTTLALAPEQLNCEIIVARDGLEALDCIHRRGGFQERPGGHPAFVLLDLKMPRVDGLEVLRQLKSDPGLRRIPVVIFTSSRELNDVARCYELGANAYVVKPMGFQKFSEAIKRVGVFWTELNELPPETGRVAEPETAAAPAPETSRSAAAHREPGFYFFGLPDFSAS